MEPVQQTASDYRTVMFFGQLQHGKSTIVGQILYYTAYMSERTLTKVADECKYYKRYGRESFSYFTHHTKEEKQGDITLSKPQMSRLVVENDTYMLYASAPGVYCPTHNIAMDIPILVVSASSLDQKRISDISFHVKLMKTQSRAKKIIVVMTKFDKCLQEERVERYTMIRQLITKLVKPYFEIFAVVPVANGLNIMIDCDLFTYNWDFYSMKDEMGLPREVKLEYDKKKNINKINNDNKSNINSSQSYNHYIYDGCDNNPTYAGKNYNAENIDPHCLHYYITKLSQSIHDTRKKEKLREDNSKNREDNSKNNKINDSTKELPFIFLLYDKFRIKGVGHVIVGKVLQGTIREKDILYYIHKKESSYSEYLSHAPISDIHHYITMTVHSIEVNYRKANQANCGDCVGLCVKGIPANMFSTYYKSSYMPIGSILSSDSVLSPNSPLLFPRYIVGDITHKKTLYEGGHYIVYSHGAHARVHVTSIMGNRIIFRILDTNINPILLSDDESMPFLRNFCLVDQHTVVAIGYVRLAKIHNDGSLDIRKKVIIHLWKSSSSLLSVLNFDILNYIFGFLDSIEITSRKRERRQKAKLLKHNNKI